MTPQLLGSYKEGLYYMDPGDTKIISSQSLMANSQASHQQISKAKLWHLRMGHLSVPMLQHLPVFDSHSCTIDSICQICPLAKQTRNVFPSSTTRSEKILQLIHVDTWGPYKDVTHNSCKFFLTIVDDFSRMTWVFLMAVKSDAVKILMDFIVYVDRQYANVQAVRTDNASEFCGKDLHNFFTQKGICHQKSCAYTPQQNGVVERKHRHLIETARALFFQSKVPSQFWGECVLSAAHLINRMPLQVLHNLSPFHKFFNKPPSLDHIRVFGCLCFVSTHGPHRLKFDKRSQPHVFIGYPADIKGHKVLNLDTMEISVSRDIIFHEQHFPYHIKSSSPSLSFFLPITTESLDFTHDFHVPDSFTIPIFDTPPADSNPTNFSNTDSSNTISSDNSSADTSNTNTESHNSPVRRSTRISKAPSHLTDYVCHNSISSVTPHWCNLVSYDSMPQSLHSFIAKADVLVEPTSYAEASKDPRWVEAMQKELQALHNNHTWILVPLPPGKKAIGCKWVFKIKFKADGSVERFKARLVAKGFNQKWGIDFLETFSPVVKMSTVRCLIALAAHRNWFIHQLDVNNAFLHGDLCEEVYMLVPEGLPNPDHMVCKLVKSLYGLKQASRQWFAKLVGELHHMQFTQSKNDYSLFIKETNGKITILAVYVDDIILTGNDVQTINGLKRHLDNVFSIKDLGRLSYFLGIEVGYLPEGITLTQKKFSKELLIEAGIGCDQHAVTPLPLNLKLKADEGQVYSDPSHYRSLVGKLNFLTHTRPDLAFTVQHLSQFLQEPREPHFNALVHVLKYVASTVGQGIMLKANEQLTLQAYSDSDWAACLNTRRSISGYVLLLGNSPISWKSKKQGTVSKSSSEAEYRSMSAAAGEVTWIVRLLEELGIKNLKPITLHCDNQSAIHIAKNPVHHERTKHIEIDIHFTRDKVMEGLLQISYLPTELQIADVLTKTLPSAKFNELLSKLGMIGDHSSLREGVKITSTTGEGTQELMLKHEPG